MLNKRTEINHVLNRFDKAQRPVESVFIPFSDIRDTKMPPTLYIILRLIDEGAPIEILRKNKFDISELAPYEYRIIDQLTVWSDFERMGLSYRF